MKDSSDLINLISCTCLNTRLVNDTVIHITVSFLHEIEFIIQLDTIIKDIYSIPKSKGGERGNECWRFDVQHVDCKRFILFKGCECIDAAEQYKSMGRFIYFSIFSHDFLFFIRHISSFHNSIILMELPFIFRDREVSASQCWIS